MRLLPFLLIVACAAPASRAATYSVGSSAACTHATVQAALNAAAANAAGPHRIKLHEGIHEVPNGLTLHNPAADITIEGGYLSCASIGPGSSNDSILDASGGANGTVLDIRSSAAARRLVTLSRVEITGGTGETGIGAASEGAGLELRGNLRVALTNRTVVRENSAVRGAGVLIEGNSAPASVELSISADSSIRDNVATQDGGGIWCFRRGWIHLEGAIDGNRAGRDGGGIWLGEQCRFTMTSAFVTFNEAATLEPGRGAGLFLRASSTLDSNSSVFVEGTPSLPAMFVGNYLRTRAFDGTGGAGMYLEGSGATRLRVILRDTQFRDNRSDGAWGSAISVNRAVQMSFTGSATRCGGIFGLGLCSGVTGDAGESFAAIRIEDMDTVDPALATEVLLRRVRMTANTTPYLIDGGGSSNPGTRVTIENSVFDRNPRLARVVETKAALAVRYSTVAFNAAREDGPLPGLVYRPASTRTEVGPIDLTGSVFWQPDRRIVNPGAPIDTVHNGCLLANDPTGIDDGDEIVIADPQLEADFTPGPASPALDVCRLTTDASFDAYGQRRGVDQPDIPNVHGPSDLGAVERPLDPPLEAAIFSDGFE